MEFEKGPNDPATKNENPLIKLALELGPLLVFVISYKFGDIFVATGLFMAATFVALVASYMLTRRLAVMPVVSGVVVAVFGTLTIVLHDDFFAKVKPTIINGLFAAVLLGGHLFGKPMLGYVFDRTFRLTDEGWRKLTLRWGLFFVFLAGVNEVVWRTQTEDFWVNFKLYGMFPLTLAFSIAQIPLLSRYSLDREDQVTPADR